MSKKWRPDIREWCNDSTEWHAFWVGFFEPWCWFWRGPIPLRYINQIAREFHYYRIGKAWGGTLLIAIVVTVAILIIRGVI